ncbi:hypothetical protein Zm00014a_034665 [Zea mays]|uniref:Uncharacterized protein n=2 Tax=Zea mays TaxID=4577 RepID=A0A8J8XC96_MAIZE|nr:hypothetical protein ZEAMMB73_Zm00001d047138 [Zea mays]AQL05708.1 hypothetical protein ZEAMMB73_Zm00001d047138 [Zea mays]PWZ07195.1 hypothetical protein Zm00014a_034665 [Zea mays]PWZ07198.1 hypothetical protein Zm00014a_034665 [Zea mays]
MDATRQYVVYPKAQG